jgi:hypothetical protein
MLSEPAFNQTGDQRDIKKDQDLHEVPKGEGKDLIFRKKKIFSVDPA